MPYQYPGLNPRTYSAPYGGIPSVPSPIGSATEAISGDIGNLGQLYRLTQGVSGAAAEGARTQYAANLPGYTPMMQSASENIAANLEGLVNPDVLNLLGTQAAERGVGFGPDSPGTNAAYLRALGLTSMGLQNLGQQQLTTAIQRTPIGPMFNPASMLITPEQMQAAALYSSQLAAAPDPAAAARASEQAANRGIVTGAGAGYSAPMAGGGRPLGAQFNEPGVVVGAAPGSAGTQIGGVTYYGGQTPEDASAAWQRWAQGLGGGGFVSTPEEDNYYYTGLTPEDEAFFSGGGGGGVGAGANYDAGYDPYGVMGPYEGVDLTSSPTGFGMESYTPFDTSFEDLYP